MPARQKAAHLPKLRAQFAEFLDEDSPARLRILSSPTSVGLRYGRPRRSLRGFSRRGTRVQVSLTTRTVPDMPGPSVPASTRYLQHRAGRAPPRTPELTSRAARAAQEACLVPPSTPTASRGRGRNMNRLSITYAPARPRLRAASPHADQRRVGTLRLAADGHSHPSFATRAGIRTRVHLHRAFRPDFAGHPTLPYPGSPPAGCPAGQEPAAASVAGLAPLHFQRRRARPVSCYTLLRG